MEVRIAVLADYALVDKQDKLSILGIFGRVVGLAEPITHHNVHLVFQFEFDTLEVGDKSINITLQDADGKLIQALNGQMLVQPLPDGAPTLVSQVINFDAITFPRFGRYEFRIQIDDYPEVCIPLTVVRVRVA